MIVNFTPLTPLQTAVLFLVFNRLDNTKQIFQAIRQAKPQRLYVAADGARTNKEGEAEKVQAVRDYILHNIDWKCEVKTLFRDQNLGCKYAVSSAITWFFNNEEQGIILEDDCLPHPTFFGFCEELLAHYRDDKRIGMISGNNLQFGKKRTNASYYYSKYSHIWGWATWKRAWEHYDVEANFWPALRDGGWLDNHARSSKDRKYWSKIFQKTHEGQIDTWDYQWLLTCWSQNMICILPNVNLVSNIGFGSDATHTHGASIYANMKVDAMAFPLNHPRIVLPHLEADAFTTRGMFNSSLPRRVLQKIRALITLMCD